MALAGNTAGISPTATLLLLPWPANVPRQLYITAARCGHQGNSKTMPFGQFATCIDFNRAAFNAGVPPWYQTKADGSDTDWTENVTLVSLFSGSTDPQERTRDWNPAVFFDADKDLLWLQQDMGGDQWWTQLAYLAPPPGIDVQPYPFVAAPPAPPPPPGPGWNTVTGPISFDGSSPGWAGYTFAVMVDPSALSAMDNGSQVRASFSGAGLALDKVYVNGHACTPDGAGNWVAPIGLDRAAGVLWKAHATAGALSTRTAAMPGVHCSYKLGDDAATAGTVGYAPSTVGVIGLKSLDVFLP